MFVDMKKNLLICTQKVDAQDQVLGFFVRWIEALAPHFETVTIVCLERGEARLPVNCRVVSLGKERGKRPAWLYAGRFLWRVLFGGYAYDTVFVHMNAEYVLLAGWWWRFLGKRVLLWRNHPSGSFWTDVAVRLAHQVFCTSVQSYTARFAKTTRMPVGIPLPEQLPPASHNVTFLSLGRISPVKHVDQIVEAFAQARLPVGASLRVVGDPIPRQIDYEYALRVEEAIDCAREQGAAIVREPGVSPERTPELYARHAFFVNATDPGSFDKTILEAAAQGCIPLVAQDLWRGTEDEDLSSQLVFPFNDPSALAQAMERVAGLTSAEREQIRQRLWAYIREHHSLEALVSKLLLAI